MTQAENQIRGMMAEQAEAMKRRDAARLVARYTADAVTYTLAPPLRNQPAQVRDAQQLQQWLDGFEGDIDFEIRDLDVTAGDEVAFAHSLNRLTAIPRGMDQPFTLWFRSTVCLRNQDGTWRIAHEHTSTPFYMDGTFRSAVDLSPEA